MRATAWRSTWLAAAVVVASACGGGGGGEPLEANPSVPTNVRAVGTLRAVTVSWDATGERLAGYHVERSADGTTFARRTARPVAGPDFVDALASPGDDGILYAYRVTAVGAVESAPSATVRAMHGTRLTGTHGAGLTTLAAESPYVVDGTLTVDAGNLTIDAGTAVYVLDGAVIDVAAGAFDDLANGRFVVKGLLRVLASAADHATFTSHKAGGLATGEGFALVFDGAPDYVAADGSGTLVRNTEVTNLRGSFTPLQVLASAPAFIDTKLVAHPVSIATYFVVYTGARFDHCLIEGLYPIMSGDLTATTFAIRHSVLRAASAWNYSLDFFHTGVGVADGQIALNDIDGTQEMDIAYVEDGQIPLGNNYWRNRQPAVRLQFTGPAVGATFTPALAEPPAGVGPSW